MGGAAFVQWVTGTEVIQRHLEVTGGLMGRIRPTLPVAQVFGLHPAVDCVLHIKQGTRVGPATHGAEWQAQRVGDRMSQTPISAGGHIKQMETARK
jgi:hypothetical protein